MRAGFGGDTPFKLYDGGMKLAKNIQRGDILIGSDYSPKFIEAVNQSCRPSLTVKQQEGPNYVCSMGQPLCLCWTHWSFVFRHQHHQFEYGDRLDMNFQDYQKLSTEGRRHLLGYSIMPQRVFNADLWTRIELEPCGEQLLFSFHFRGPPHLQLEDGTIVYGGQY